MKFELEIDLVRAFREHLDAFLPTGSSIGFCRPEKRIKRQYADLVLADFSCAVPENDRKNLLKVNSWLQEQLARACSKPLDPEAVCGKFYPRTEARRLKQIASLVRWGFMESLDDQTAITSQEIQTILPTTAVAFEAKLSDWQGAIRQANHYRRFCHESWVVMPEAFSEDAQIIASCEEQNLGFAVVTANNIEKVVPARRANDSIPRRKMRFELVVDFARYGETDRWFFVG